MATGSAARGLEEREKESGFLPAQGTGCNQLVIQQHCSVKTTGGVDQHSWAPQGSVVTPQSKQVKV